MARTKKLEAPTEVRDQPATPAQLVTRASPLVFVSHDTRDADLAEAFDNLLTDASGGVVKTFRSSDRKDKRGSNTARNGFQLLWRSSMMLLTSSRY